jgi:hypothetical protein
MRTHIEMSTAWGSLASRMGVMAMIEANCSRLTNTFMKPQEVASPTYWKVISTPSSNMTELTLKMAKPFMTKLT